MAVYRVLKGSDEKLTSLANQVKVIVELQATVADWNNRDDIKAELQMNIIILLSQAGYPPIIHDEVFKEILEQAENFKRFNPRLGTPDIEVIDRETPQMAAEPLACYGNANL